MLPIIALTAGCADYERAPENDLHWTPDQIADALYNKGAQETVDEDYFYDEDYLGYDAHYDESLWQTTEVSDFYAGYDATTATGVADDRIRLHYVSMSDHMDYWDTHDMWGYVHDYDVDRASSMIFEFQIDDQQFCSAELWRSAALLDPSVDWRFTYRVKNPEEASAGDEYSCWDEMHGADAFERINDILFY